MSVIRPEDDEGIEPAAAALRRAAGISSPYVLVAAEPAEQAAEVLTALSSLRHGPMWPPLDELLRTARGFFPGALAESDLASSQGRLLG